MSTSNGTDRLRNRISGRVLASSNGQAKKPKKAGGRFAAINWFIDVKMAELTEGERGVWLVLWREERGGVASVSMQTIATKAGMDRRSVIRSMNKLIDGKLVRRIEKGNSAKATCNKYTLTTPT